MISRLYYNGWYAPIRYISSPEIDRFTVFKALSQTKAQVTIFHRSLSNYSNQLLQQTLQTCCTFGSWAGLALLLPTESAVWSWKPRSGCSVVSVSDTWPGGCEFDTRLRRTFFPAYFRPSPLLKHVRKVVGGFGKKVVLVTLLVWESQETHVRNRPPWYDLSC